MSDSRPPAANYCGLDIGGTKIELIACGDDLQVGYRRRVATPTRNYDDFLRAVGHLVKEAEDHLGTACQAVGIGLPGRLYPVKLAALPPLTHKESEKL